MFTPKLEVVRVLEIPLVTTTFSPTIIHENKIVPQSSSESPEVSKQSLFEELEKLCPGEFHQGSVDILKVYGSLDTRYDGRFIVLKSRMDIIFDWIFEQLVGDIRCYSNCIPNYLNDIILSEEIEMMRNNDDTVESILADYYDKIYDYHLNIYTDEDICDMVGREIVGQTEHLYLIKEY